MEASPNEIRGSESGNEENNFDGGALMPSSIAVQMAERNSVREKGSQNKLQNANQSRPRQATVGRKQSNPAVTAENNASSKQSTYSGSATGRDYADQMVTQLEQQNEQLRQEQAYYEQQAQQKFAEMEQQKKYYLAKI